MCLSLCQYCAVLITVALSYSLKFGIFHMSRFFSFFSEDFLVNWGFWCFPKNFRIVCSSSVKNVMGILKMISLSVDGFGYYGCFNSILPIQGYRLSFHFFVSSLISFINIL